MLLPDEYADCASPGWWCTGKLRSANGKGCEPFPSFQGIWWGKPNRLVSAESRKWSRNKRWATDASISARRAGSFTFFGAFKQAGGVLDQLVMGDCDHLQTMLLVF